MLHHNTRPNAEVLHMIAIYLLITVALGTLISTQPAINAQIALRLGSPLMAAAVSITISLILVIVTWAAIGRTEANWSKLASLPWWALIGGAAGALFVLAGVLIAPRLGVAMFFICVVLGQLVGAALIDQFGAFGVQGQAISWPRAAGIMLVIAGAALTQAGAWLKP